MSMELQEWVFEDLPPLIDMASGEEPPMWREAVELYKRHCKEVKRMLREENFRRSKLEKRAAAAVAASAATGTGTSVASTSARPPARAPEASPTSLLGHLGTKERKQERKQELEKSREQAEEAPAAELEAKEQPHRHEQGELQVAKEQAIARSTEPEASLDQLHKEGDADRPGLQVVRRASTSSPTVGEVGQRSLAATIRSSCGSDSESKPSRESLDSVGERRLSDCSTATATSRGSSLGGRLSSSAGQDSNASPQAGQAASSTPTSGKGPGKGKGPALPKAPPIAAQAKRQATPPSKEAKSRSNGLTNIYWKVSHEPESCMLDMASEPLCKRLITACSACHDRQDAFDVQIDGTLIVPQRPMTVFSPAPPVPQLPEGLLEHYFSRSESRGKGQGTPRADSHRDENGHEPLLDSKQNHSLEIIVKKYLMDHKGKTSRDAVKHLAKSVLQCDFIVVKTESLNAFRKILEQHIQEGAKLLQFVQDHGEQGLDALKQPEHHRLIYEMLRLPQVVKRMECMLYRLHFPETLRSCEEGLDTLISALRMLRGRKEVIRRFFLTAHRFGQSLNRDSQAPLAERGFQLSALEKMSQTKSSKYPQFSMMHFVLALLSPVDAASLFTRDDIALLHKAKTLTAHMVRRDSLELVQGLCGVQTALKCIRSVDGDEQSRQSSSAAAAAQDRFGAVMGAFVAEREPDVERVAKRSNKMLKMYKLFAIWFDDLSSVWPPPKNSNDGRLDLFDVFHRFAENVMRHREEVERESVRALVLDA